MKKVIRMVGCCLMLAVLWSACTRAIDEEWEEADAGHSVQVLTRAETEIVYPLWLFAFDRDNGELVARAEAKSAAEGIKLGLTEGSYRLVALGGAGECTVPSAPVLEDILTLPEGNLLQNPLQMGSADVTVNRSMTVNLTLAYQVAAVELTLESVPTDVTAVNVTLSPLYEGLALDGSFVGNVSTTVSLSQEEDGVWSTPTFYTLPGASDQLTLSISLARPDGEEVYGYTCNKTLEKATPYQLSGNYQGGMMVSGTFTVSGWEAPQSIEFFFGTEQEEDNQEGEDDNQEESIETETPVAGILWQGHFIGAVENVTESSADLLLLSRDEWYDVPSCYNEENPDAAQTLADAYSEDGLTGWSIPTTAEAKAIRTAIGNSALETTNETLTANGLAPLSDNVKDDNGNQVRYLCEAGSRALTWDESTSKSVSKTGKTRTYYLRVVKRVTVKMEKNL